ncbi:dipeptide ABC transporter ATP-binding protein [Caproiciproducens galactitolivorans]|uniref:Oligopeptide transport ATP-binding protein OppF n=1 Tax=Caproiciproducens galactitolivorans TaxID=642589 RepID=A0A4Z0YCX4_9FIRM|nr:dipeptide ABC transporter ATP-binding protein [Caproiciproducens galactitolivorans]QEY35559.1 dipeptide ABC transporter ATP-binding protein [Caproiciproducens galactitolivorans]TGJ77285.1 oligopeptide transport ATP-binding protein OppF [Caproiciproducens galactitolivorans]
MSEPLVVVKDLVKTFVSSKGLLSPKRYVHAVTDVSFTIHPKETFALVGESGCGKSTTGRLVTRLLHPDAGQVIFDGTDITNYTVNQMRPLRSNMQMVFQDPYGSLNPRIKIEDLVAEPLKIHTNLSAEERRKVVYELLEVVGLRTEHADRYPHEFSGGQRQRIGIARALSVRPKLIVADEPVSALDVSIQAQVLNLLKELQQKYELTYLFISHDLSVVEMIADKIGVMYLGKLVESAPKEELYSNPLHPYTKALLSAVPIPDPTHKRNRIILKGDLPSPVYPPSGCMFHTRCPNCTEQCKVEKPALREVSKDHFVACPYV